MPIDLPVSAEHLKALSHPARLAILETLSYRGALTATQVADIVGESPSNCSWHLRTLAAAGLVERAPGGNGRDRPWQISFSSDEFVTAERDQRIRGLLAHRQLDRMLEAMARLGPGGGGGDSGLDETDVAESRSTRVAVQGSNATWLTEAEAREIADRFRHVLALVPDFEERRRDPAARPEGARLYEFAGWLVPLEDQP